jgi:hypothetical protein
VQPPFVHPSAVVPQRRHAAPAVPQLERFDCSQTPLLQHPPGHDWALQTHVEGPFGFISQTCPVPQAPPTPQEHCPPLQLSDFVGSHFVHDRPPAPHSAWSGDVTHVPMLQQPVGQETESHRQVPLRQCWPTAHSAFAPQAQPPAVEQLSVLTASQAMHAEPFVPHAPIDRPLHVDPEQQPLGQLAAQPEHTPMSQDGTAPAVQAWQDDPPLPHTSAL